MWVLRISRPWLQAKEYIRELEGPSPHMRAWGVGGDSAPLDLINQMQQVGPDECMKAA